MLVGSSPGSCTPMQVQVNMETSLHHRGIHEPAAASDHSPSWIGSKGALQFIIKLFSSLKHTEELERDCSSHPSSPRPIISMLLG
jgi:hypothetical protein